MANDIIDDEELVKIVDGEFTRAIGAPDGDISTERARGLDAYLSNPRGNEVAGRSKARTSDVADVIDGIMPSLLRMFTTADNLLLFDPVGPEDADAASQESDYVNHVFFKETPAFMTLYSWFFDALVEKNGIVKAWHDDKSQVTREAYEALSDAELAELLADDELELVSRKDRDIVTVAGDGATLVNATVHDVVFRRESSRGKVMVMPVPSNEFRISADAREIDPSSARFVGHERPVKRYELLDMGFDPDIVDSLPADTIAIGTAESRVRRNKSDDTHGLSAPHRSQDEVTLREAYIRIDADADSSAELIQVFTASGKLLSREEVDRQPFHVITPKPIPHKHVGRSVAELVEDIQEITTALLRQTLDNLYQTNNPGHAVWEQGIGEDTLDDLLTVQIGRVVRFARSPGESYAPMTVPFTAQSSFGMLDFFDKQKRDRTGVSSDSQGLSPDALKNIQTTVLSQAIDMSRMKIEAIARIFAETGLKTLFLHIHELLLKHQDKPKVVRLRGEWVQVSPQQWRERTDMTVNIGLGLGTREQNLVQLEAIFQKQQSFLQAGLGGLLVKPSNLFNVAAEFVRNANLKQPELYFSDPGDAEAPPPNAQQLQLQQQQQALQQKEQEITQERQQLNTMRAQIQMQELQLRHQREMLDLRRKSEKDKDDFAIEMEKIKNKLTELELVHGENIPGGRT